MTMTFFRKNNLRCPVCLAEFNNEAMTRAGVKGCPHCKTLILPMAIAHDGYVHVNWQDLRMLAIYAQRWAVTFQPTPSNLESIKAFDNIIRKLTKFQPPGSQPLTLPVDPVIQEMIEKRVQEKISPQLGIVNGKITTAAEDEEMLHRALKPDANGKIVSPFFRKFPL